MPTETAGYHLVSAQALQAFTARAFREAGTSEEDAEIAAKVLVRTDLRGVETHGVLRLPSYVRSLREGRINPRPRLKVLQESPSTLFLDGDNGSGLVLSARTMEFCIEKAKGVGGAFAAVRHSTHNGAVSIHAMRALKHDMIGLCMTTGGTMVPPTFGRERMLGLNPLGVAVPSDKEPPFVLDMSTSVAAGGKIQVAAMKGLSIPLGWALDKHGNPTSDPNEVSDGGTLLPLGSTPELGSYKGYAPSLLLDILCNVLTGMTPCPIGAKGQVPSGRRGRGQFFAALRVDRFGPVAEFKDTMDECLHLIRTSEKTEGYDRIYTPGEMEYERENERRENGIPLYYKVVDSLREMAGELDIEWNL